MEVSLHVACGLNAGQVVPISGSRFLMGRAEDCQLRPFSELVSAYHCALLLENDRVLVRDLGSKDGTFVNGQRVYPEVELTHGDRLRVGQLEFEVQIGTAVRGKNKPAVPSVQEANPRAAPATKPLDEDDVRLEEWFAEEEEPPSATTEALDGTPEDHGTAGFEQQTAARQGPVEPGAPASAGPDVGASPGGSTSWDPKPIPDHVAEMADEVLKQRFQGDLKKLVRKE